VHSNVKWRKSWRFPFIPTPAIIFSIRSVEDLTWITHVVHLPHISPLRRIIVSFDRIGKTMLSMIRRTRREVPDIDGSLELRLNVFPFFGSLRYYG